MNIRNIKDRIVTLLKDKSSGIQPEFRQQLADIAKRIEDLLRDNRGECDIHDDLIKEIARCLVPDIIALLCAVRSNIDIKNKSEPLDVHEVVRICSVW